MKKIKVAILFVFIQRLKKPEKILDEKCGKFFNALNFLRIRTQIFPKIDEKLF